MRDIDKADYARGFLISPSDYRAKTPHWWSQATFGDYQVKTDPRVQVAAIQDKVLLIGHAVDISTTESNLHELVAKLCDELQSSLDSFQEAVSDLCGRFVIIYKHDGIMRLQQDAIGMRSVYFGAIFSGIIAGSHAHLVAMQVGTTPSVFSDPKYLKTNNLAVLPGRSTEFNHVTALTPNTELSLSSGIVRRIYFGSPQRNLNPTEAARIVSDNASAQAAYLQKPPRLYVSLSAGLDSRVTSALIRDLVPSVTFFTYDVLYNPKNQASEHDRDVALELAKKFDLNHKMLDIETRELPSALKSSFDKNSSKAHSRPLAAAYVREFSGGLHVRSNGYEIGRAYYQGEHRQHTHLTGADMLSIISGGKSNDPAAVNAFDEFIEATSFSEVSSIAPLDLFYWEHRMGMWMTPILLESDVAHDTHILVNHRPTLEAMLGVSFQDQVEGTVPDEIVRSRWPELYEVPVNGIIR